MMDKMEDGMTKILEKRYPDLKIKKTDRRNTVLLGLQKSWLSEYSSLNMDQL